MTRRQLVKFEMLRRVRDFGSVHTGRVGRTAGLRHRPHGPGSPHVRAAFRDERVEQEVPAEIPVVPAAPPPSPGQLATLS